MSKYSLLYAHGSEAYVKCNIALLRKLSPVCRITPKTICQSVGGDVAIKTGKDM